MASLLAAFLVSNGAADPVMSANQGKPGKDEKSEAKPGGLSEQLDRFGRRLRGGPAQETAKPEEPKEAAKPDATKPEAAGIEPGRHGRNARRLARPGDAPAAEGQAPDQAAGERGSDGRKLSAKQKLSKRGKPGGEEPPKSESGKSESGKTEPANTEPGKEEPAKGEAAKEETPKSESAKTEMGKTEPGKIETGKSDTAKVESGKPEGTMPDGMKPPADAKSESGKIETPKETGGGQTQQRDPVPPVTPAPAASTAASGGTAEPLLRPPCSLLRRLRLLRRRLRPRRGRRLRPSPDRTCRPVGASPSLALTDSGILLRYESHARPDRADPQSEDRFFGKDHAQKNQPRSLIQLQLNQTPRTAQRVLIQVRRVCVTFPTPLRPRAPRRGGLRGRRTRRLRPALRPPHPGLPDGSRCPRRD